MISKRVTTGCSAREKSLPVFSASLELLFQLYYSKDDDQQHLKVSLAVNGIHFNLKGEETHLFNPLLHT